ncbi:MAG: hypothetical protein HONDAALG_02612 [Gammaproteobacteria bacterium]|nr:hypothetical protein [Gammaproteobacteria bacterium]
MKSKSESSKTSSAKKPAGSIEDFSIYDVPGANLDAREVAYRLLKLPDEEAQSIGREIIDLLSKCIRAMGREDVGLVLKAGAGEQVADARSLIGEGESVAV